MVVASSPLSYWSDIMQFCWLPLLVRSALQCMQRHSVFHRILEPFKMHKGQLRPQWPAISIHQTESKAKS